jgi:site-specific DNA-methyltransferase (adenine-specific)
VANIKQNTIKGLKAIFCQPYIYFWQKIILNGDKEMINELIQCDCMDYMRTCKDKQFDLTIADPWYGVGMSKNDTTGFAKKRFRGQAKNNDSAPTEEYFSEILRVSKECIIWGGNYFLDYLDKCVAPIIWDKGTGANYFADGEMAWTSFKTGCLRIYHHQWCGCFKDSERGIKLIHPCQKPIELYEWCIIKYAKSGMKLFDPNSGSGSFRIAAYDMGFDLVSCEIDADYYHDNEARYQAHIMQQELIPVQEIQQLTFNDV